MNVDRCICHDITFAEVKAIAQERGLNSVEEIEANRIACSNCKLCVPYIKRMLKTGETVFDRSVRYLK